MIDSYANDSAKADHFNTFFSTRASWSCLPCELLAAVEYRAVYNSFKGPGYSRWKLLKNQNDYFSIFRSNRMSLIKSIAWVLFETNGVARNIEMLCVFLFFLSVLSWEVFIVPCFSSSSKAQTCRRWLLPLFVEIGRAKLYPHLVTLLFSYFFVFDFFGANFIVDFFSYFVLIFF